jgi:CspA family cold shock protein
VHFSPLFAICRLTRCPIYLNCTGESWRGFEQPADFTTGSFHLNIKILEGCRCMEMGTVKWFNNAKGFGFICPEGGGEDIFAHYSTIQMDGYRTLKAGQPVRFDVHQGPKGNHASVIVPVEAETAAVA